jgi:hypothetical protein
MKLRSPAVGMLALAVLAGCASVPPENITADRMGYGEVVADSWKRQTLLNVVRLRYADTPVFLDVTSIINSYSITGKLNASAQLPSSEPDTLVLGGDRTWSNTPTVTYQPLMGDRFTRSLLQPVPPSSLFQLLQGGWSADMVLSTVATSVNGLRNSNAGVAADPEFLELLQALSRVQRAGGLGIRVEPRAGGAAVVMMIRHEHDLPSADGRRIMELLGLEGDAVSFDVAYGLVPASRNEVALLSRSMLEIMLQVGFGIELPEGDVAAGRALPGQWQDGQPHAAPGIRIQSGPKAPDDAYAAIPYRGHWFWIANDDIASKRTFTFLMILFSLAETGQTNLAPQVTVPAR